LSEVPAAFDPHEVTCASAAVDGNAGGLAGEAAPAVLRGVMYWYGLATGSWWAVVPSSRGPLLVEAASRDTLAVTVRWHLRRSA